MIALALVLAVAAPDATTRAKASEEAAFAAIERREWCEALRLFLDADRHAPADDFLLNAAMAAEYAADRQAARDLYARVVAHGGPRALDGKTRAATLEDTIKQYGIGASCPTPAATVNGSAPPAPASPLAATAPVEAPADEPSSTLPLLVSASGAGLVVTGATLAIIGGVPWFQHASAASALQQAEASSSDDAASLKALQREQAGARESWEGWGRALVVVGIVTSAVGAVALAAAGALFFMESE